MTSKRIDKLIKEVQSTDKNAIKKCRQEWDNVAKPLSSLGKLEDIVAKLAGIESTAVPPLRKKAYTVFCADSKITNEGVTQTSSDVTMMMAENIAEGKASSNIFARVANADIFVIDAGMKTTSKNEKILVQKTKCGTEDFLLKPAMKISDLEAALENGANIAKKFLNLGYNLIISGEMGIGNTTCAAALLCALTGADPEIITGKGAGLTEIQLCHKKEVIKKSLERANLTADDTLSAMCEFSGFDIAQMAGLYLGAAIYKIPVIVDGFISQVAAAAAVRLNENVKDFLFASHISTEPGSILALKTAKLKGYLDLGMHLGEGTGAAVFSNLFDFALEEINYSAKFNEAGVEQYKHL